MTGRRKEGKSTPWVWVEGARCRAGECQTKYVPPVAGLHPIKQPVGWPCCRLQAAGFTISPLTSKYVPPMPVCIHLTHLLACRAAACRLRASPFRRSCPSSSSSFHCFPAVRTVVPMLTGLPHPLQQAAGFTISPLMSKYVPPDACLHPKKQPVGLPCCCLQAAGFTISPLMSKYVRLAGGEESQESLVSLALLLGGQAQFCVLATLQKMRLACGETRQGGLVSALRTLCSGDLECAQLQHVPLEHAIAFW